jgi:hypothetical protein
MNLNVALWTARAVYFYLGIGLLLLPWWQLRGLAKLDRAAAEGPWGFRILISFGLVALWPVLFRRIATADGHPPAERNPHRDAAEGKVSS